MELIIVPTAHVSKSSVRKVRETILREKPDIVAIELCPLRFRSMMRGEKPKLRQMLSMPLYSALFLLQQLLGALFGSKPGSEMKEAINCAAELKIPILLADAPVSQTMKKLGAIPLREKLGLVFQIFTIPFSKGPKRANLSDLTNPSFLAPILLTFRSHFPLTYKYLVEDRNQYMFKSLLNFPNKKIVLVIGAGHTEGIGELARQNHLITNPPITCVIA